MKQELIDTTIDLYTISRKIKIHDIEFSEKYPEIYAELNASHPTKRISVGMLLLKELSFFKKMRK
jgi:hypothetical protein